MTPWVRVKPQDPLAHRSRRAGVVQGLVTDLQERREGLTQRPAIAATGYSVIRSPFSFTALGTYSFQCTDYARCIDYLLVNILFREMCPSFHLPGRESMFCQKQELQYSLDCGALSSWTTAASLKLSF